MPIFIENRRHFSNVEIFLRFRKSCFLNKKLNRHPKLAQFDFDIFPFLFLLFDVIKFSINIIITRSCIIWCAPECLKIFFDVNLIGPSSPSKSGPFGLIHDFGWFYRANAIRFLKMGWPPLIKVPKISSETLGGGPI